MTIHNQGVAAYDNGDLGTAISADARAIGLLLEVAFARPDKYGPCLVTVYAAQACYLARVGNLPESVHLQAQAVEFAQLLAEYDKARFGGLLANALSDKALLQVQAGRREEALRSFDEAETLLAERVSGGDMQAGRDLVVVLHRRGLHQLVARQLPGALQAATKAVQLSLQLVREQSQPDAATSALLASALGLQATVLNQSGALSQGLQLLGGVTDLYRSLAIQDDAYVDNLGDVLHDVGATLDRLNRPKEAHTAWLETVELRRRRATSERVAQIRLTRALSGLSTNLHNLGQHDQALAISDEAARHVVALVGSGDKEAKAELAKVLLNRRLPLRAYGRWDDAARSATEAITLLRALAGQDPDNFNAVLARALIYQSACLDESGQSEGALAALKAATFIWRELALADPGTGIDGLAVTLNNESTLLNALGRKDEAIDLMEEAIAARREERAIDRSTPPVNLAICLVNYANSLEKMDRPDESVRASSEAVSLFEEYASRSAQAAQQMAPFLTTALLTELRVLAKMGLDREAELCASRAASVHALWAAQRPGSPDVRNAADQLARYAAQASI